MHILTETQQTVVQPVYSITNDTDSGNITHAIDVRKAMQPGQFSKDLVTGEWARIEDVQQARKHPPLESI